MAHRHGRNHTGGGRKGQGFETPAFSFDPVTHLPCDLRKSVQLSAIAFLSAKGGLDKAMPDQTMATKTQDKAERQNNSAYPRRVLVMGQIPLKRQLIGKLGQEDGNDLTLALVP